MKKIYFILLAVVMLLNFAPGIYAQQTRAGEGEGEEEPDYTIDGVFQSLLGETLHFTTGSYKEEKNVGFSKEISAPVDGKYYIKLEALATGTATVTSVSKPSDIILVLDYSTSMNDSYGSITRKRALRNAVRAFLTTIHDNDRVARNADSNYAGDRVAIISFNEHATTRYPLTQISEGYSDMYASYNNDPPVANYTNPAEGLELAMAQWQSGGNPTTDESRTRAVVVFTDGCPSWHMSYVFDSDYVAETINNGNTLKSSYGASIYTIGLFNTNDSSWNTLGQPIIDYMNFLSSNFTGVTAACNNYPSRPSTSGTAINGTVTYSFSNYANLEAARAADAYATQAEAVSGNSDYFFMASDDPSSLNSIFQKVANQTGGSANSSLSAATATVDVVASSFDLPSGANTEIYIFTAPYRMNAAGTGPEWGPETLANHSGDVYDRIDADGNILERGLDVDDSIEYSIEGQKISVTGFDYSSNWCGPIKSGNNIIGYQGHKLIIVIPIQMSENAVGGPNVATNEEGSGIYINPDDEDPVVKFVSQHVSLPTNIHINKQNLKVGESAKFDIMRATLPADWPAQPTAQNYKNLTWSYVSSVFVTRHSNDDEDDPIVKIKGLPSATTSGDYIYKIVESDWGWSYVFSKATDTTGEIEITDKELVTTDKFITNPIIFVNTPETDIDFKVRHAESKATNSFIGSGTVGYDDSKSNGRTVIGESTTPAQN